MGIGSVFDPADPQAVVNGTFKIYTLDEKKIRSVSECSFIGISKDPQKENSVKCITVHPKNSQKYQEIQAAIQKTQSCINDLQCFAGQFTSLSGGSLFFSNEMRAEEFIIGMYRKDSRNLHPGRAYRLGHQSANNFCS